MTERLKPPPLPRVAARPERGRVLVVAPHADDEVIGCGGTMILHAEQNDPVSVLILTNGSGGDPDHHWEPAEYVAMRQREALAGGAVLGTTDYTFWEFPDNHELTESDVTMVTERLRDHLLAHRPEIVYYPWECEVHSDHWFGSLAARHAMAALPFAVHAFGYEVWTPCVPDWIVDVSRVYARKLEALRQHVSQLQFQDHVTKTLGMNAHRSIYLERDATHGEAFVFAVLGGGAT
ncbi:MAG: PIG-L family deacetylase [Planctomycetes bacterium]|nr:PIG-L family deacetylase [Planctomycetota bacterium]